MDNWRTYPQEAPTEFERITFYSHTLSFYFTGVYSGFKWGTSDSVGEVWSGEYIRRIRTGDLWKYDEELPPPHSPAHPNDTPLVETATATADNDDEITADKLVSIGFSPDTPWLYSRETRSDTFIVFDEDDNSICITNGDGTINITAHVTTMTELRTLIRWLS